MNVGDIRRRIRALMGDDVGAVYTDTITLDWINDGQLQVARRTKSLVTLLAALGNTVQGQESYSLTALTGILGIVELHLDGVLLYPITREELNSIAPDRNLTGSEETGVPRYYIFEYPNIILYPAPASPVKAITVTYQKGPAALTAETDNLSLPFQMHEDVFVYCMMRAKEMDEDYAGAKIYRDDFELRVSNSASEFSQDNQADYPVVRDVDEDMHWVAYED